MHETSCRKSSQNSSDGLRVRKSGRKEAKGAGDKLEGLFMHTLLMVRGTS